MKEKLIIDNFAGMKHIELDINNINLLIGPQATGKSVCAKLLYFFKYFIYEMLNAAERGKSIKDFNNSIMGRFTRYFPMECLDRREYKIDYILNNSKIEIRCDKDLRPFIKYSEYFNQLYGTLTDAYIEYKRDEGKIGFFQFREVRESIFKLIEKELGSPSCYRQIFIPSGRSFFSNVRSNIFSILSAQTNIDPFLIEFGSYYEVIKEYPAKTLLRKDKTLTNDINIYKRINSLIESIILSTYIKEKDKEYLKHDDGRRTDLPFTSSGQQEILPLSILLKYLSEVRFIDKGVTVYIEEPEAHLFPISQRTAVDLISIVYNESNNPMQYFITTHSPYILTSFNNLIEAGIVRKKVQGNEEKLKKLYEIVPKEQILNPAEVTVWTLHDGITENIMDKETGLISADAIDNVSDELAEQFDKLLDLE